MHILTFIDAMRLRQDGPMLGELLNRLEQDEGFNFSLVVPDDLPDDLLHVMERGLAEGPVLKGLIPCPLWQRRRQASMLADEVHRTPPDLMWAIGAETHALVEAMAQQVECPVAVSTWTSEETRRASARQHHVGAWIAPTHSLATTLKRRVGKELVQCIPPGITVRPESPREIGLAPTLGLLSSGRDQELVRGVLTGLRDVVAVVPDLQICMELDGGTGHTAWREADAMGLLDHVSTISDAALVRDLMTTCDLILHPNRSGNVRTILLEAMAESRTIISVDAPGLDWLIDGETAILVEGSEPASWSSTILGVLNDAGKRLRIGRNARKHVIEHHDPASQASALAATFRGACKGVSFPFSSRQTKQA